MKNDRLEIFIRDNWRCWYCGIELSQTEQPGSLQISRNCGVIDHQTPTAKGGSDDPSNKVASCFRCNAQKQGRTVEEYRAYLQIKESPAARAAKGLSDVMTELSKGGIKTPFDGQLLRAILHLNDLIKPIVFYREM